MSTSFGHVATLRDLESIASTCTACTLSEGRTNVVFSSGSVDASVMVVGEGPGREEDEQGIPFVGRSGQLLAQLLGEIGLDRGDVYIANVVKCRPPNNRDPRQDEIDACKPYLRRQIELVDPAVVVTVGNFSSKLLLATTTGITRLRGSAYEWWGRYLVPTFHPAAALRGGEQVTNQIRADLMLVRDIIDGRISPEVEPDSEPEPESPTTPEEPVQTQLFGRGQR
ncbi:MAG: uracil-DNA glycosylase [Actinomycetota bacterium]